VLPLQQSAERVEDGQVGLGHRGLLQTLATRHRRTVRAFDAAKKGLNRAGLADSGFPGDEEHLAPPGQRSFERRFDPREWLLATYEEAVP
jgi:hypothetical protein